MNTKIGWRGVMPATTTPFREDGSIDHEAAARRARALVEAGCTALVPHGSLGEGGSLRFEEKLALERTLVAAVAGRVPVIPGIAALSTAEAVELARAARANGCSGLMVLPPYAYSTDAREMGAHVAAVIGATDLPCLLYNNPIAYGTDFLPDQVIALAREHRNLEAVKESSADVRRITAIRALAGDRLAVGVGVDDQLVEGVAAGAAFWIAGLVNAFPRESARLFELAARGPREDCERLYRWFLPLLRLDTGPKFVQLIKLAEEKVGMGPARLRPPRLPLEGAELAEAERIVGAALAARPG